MERAPPTLVLDASTATKWFVKEDDTEKALSLRDAHQEGRITLAAPDLLVYEVGNALNYNPKVSTSNLTGAVRGLLDLELDLVPPSAEYSSHTVKTARKFSISAYDASYIALSDMMATYLVTADRRLYEKLSGAARIYLIGQLDVKWSVPH